VTHEPQPDRPARDPGPRREAALVWVGSLALSGLFGILGLFIPIVADNLLALVAATFLYLPAAALWRRGVDLTDYGLKARPVGLGIGLFLLVTIIVMPPFALGHRLWQSWLFDREPVVSADRLERFDRELESRPDLSSPNDGLLVWVERNKLMMLWTREGSVEARVTVSHRTEGADPIVGLLGLLATEDGRLVGGSRGATRIENGDTLYWRRNGPGGVTFGLDDIDGLTLRTDAPVFKGRYGVRAEAPLETSRSEWWWLVMFGTQLILVAIPEEWFYRGYLQKRLDEAFRPRWKVLGAMMGPGWILSSVMFALGHLVLDARPERLAVFFPSLLFGWMRTRTGSILAPALFHALSNVWIQGLNYIYLG